MEEFESPKASAEKPENIEGAKLELPEKERAKVDVANKIVEAEIEKEAATDQQGEKTENAAVINRESRLKARVLSTALALGLSMGMMVGQAEARGRFQTRDTARQVYLGIDSYEQRVQQEYALELTKLEQIYRTEKQRLRKLNDKNGLQELEYNYQIEREKIVKKYEGKLAKIRVSKGVARIGLRVIRGW